MNPDVVSSPIQQVKQSRPHINNKSHSILSSSAGYLSDYASDASSTPSAPGYETPPSRLSTPARRHRQAEDESEMTLPLTGYPAAPARIHARQNNGYGTQAGHNNHQDVPNEHDRLSPPTPGVDDGPYIRFALEQLTFDEDLAGRGRYSSGIDNQQQLQQQQKLAAVTEQQPIQTQDSPSSSQNKKQPPPQRPFNFPRPSTDSRRPKTSDIMLLPSDPPEKRHQLGFVPTPLRPLSIGILVLLCALMITGLIFSNVYALANHGLFDYNGNTTPRYFVFEYLPALLGMIIIFWIFVIQAAIYRSAPYFAISTNLASETKNKTLQAMPIHPANFILPDLRFFRLGEPLVGVILCIFWITNFTVPFLSCLYGTQWFTNVDTPRFRWTPIQGLGWFIMIMYLLLVVALVLCLIRFRRRRSALMWDPTSLADLIILFQRSNILSDYQQSETKQDLEEELTARYCRLGYWTTNHTSDYFYAVGEANQPYLELANTWEKTSNEKMQSTRTSAESQEGFRNSGSSAFLRMLHSPWVRHRWCPWFLRDGAIVAWAIAAVLLLIAFLTVSFVNRAVQDGFYALVAATTQTNGFSPANFLYSFIPSLLGMFLFLAWQPIDVYFRSVQAYVNLSEPHGATAHRSILLSYNAQLPGFVTLRAIRNRDWKVAHFSFLSLLAATIPVLAGGVFTALLFRSGAVRMVASMPGYIALCVILAIYALSFLVIWPTRFRYLPHSINTVAGNLSFLYASRLLKDSSIRNIRTKDDFIARLDGRVNTAMTGDGKRKRRSESFYDSSTYGFGIYVGIDGKEHLGIDRMHRAGGSDTNLATGRESR